MVAKGIVIVAVLALGFLLAGCGCNSGGSCASSESYGTVSTSETCNFIEEPLVNGQDFQTNEAYWDCSGM